MLGAVSSVHRHANEPYIWVQSRRLMRLCTRSWMDGGNMACASAARLAVIGSIVLVDRPRVEG